MTSTQTGSATTLRAAAGLTTEPAPLAQSAVIVIDAQLEYAIGALPLSGIDAALDRIVDLLTVARRLARPIVHIVHHGKPGGLFDPSEGGRLIEELEPDDGERERIITKQLPNAFAATELGDHLADLGNPPLLLTGFMTHMCVSSTARAALDLGHATTVLADATATRSLPAAPAPAPAPAPGLAGTPAGAQHDLPAEMVHRSALAELADRFSIVANTAAILDQPLTSPTQQEKTS